MFGYTVSTAVGRATAAETDNLFRPRSPRPNSCGVILLHGSGSPQGFVDVNTQPSSVKLAAAIASMGLPCMAGVFGGQTWGNANTHIDNAWNYLQSQYPDMRTDKVILVGGSMGGANAAHYCQTNPDNVAAFVGLIPLLDIAAFFEADTYGTAAEIRTAWGVTAPDPLPSEADIAANVALAADIPTLLGYSTVDTIALPAWVTAYGAAVNADMVITDTTAGHSDAAVGGMPIPTVGAFIAAHT